MDVHHVAVNGNMAGVELVAEYAPDRINEINSRGQAPLHEAATMDGRVAKVEWSLERVNEAGYNGSPPLHMAARTNQEAAVSFLLSAGANVN